ncbi:DUF3332 domain-containing protein [Photobacterium sanctipauli]|uniref:DUF3332 domain-containing protein n=1 Tax=Photobacterium sanctipauli TaxID=1342794 RepID=A0A2T3P084_9GAMM|nr:DUF3332 domain-containing protein [Photobacterium sanctipauli]
MKVTLFSKVAIAVVAGVMLSGCVGSNVATNKLMEYNVKAVDNRYARGGLNMLMSPVYGVTVAADYLVLNSLEFWTGSNPVTGSPHVFDTKTETWIDVNENIDESLRSAPIKVTKE